MQIRLHRNARTTPTVREGIHQSALSERALAKKHGISRRTARRSKARETVEDPSHRPHTLYAAVNTAVSRSRLDRCPRRHGVASLKALLPSPVKPPVKSFKAFEPGLFHVPATRFGSHPPHPGA